MQLPVRADARRSRSAVSAATEGDHHLGRVVHGRATVVNTRDPDKLVIGGGRSTFLSCTPERPDRLADAIFSPCSYTPIMPAARGDSSGVSGAARLWKD